MVINHLLTGMILQVGGASRGVGFPYIPMMDQSFVAGELDKEQAIIRDSACSFCCFPWAVLSLMSNG